MKLTTKKIIAREGLIFIGFLIVFCILGLIAEKTSHKNGDFVIVIKTGIGFYTLYWIIRFIFWAIRTLFKKRV